MVDHKVTCSGKDSDGDIISIGNPASFGHLGAKQGQSVISNHENTPISFNLHLVAQRLM